jgi:hypothetical protein
MNNQTIIGPASKDNRVKRKHVRELFEPAIPMFLRTKALQILDHLTIIID